VDFQDPPKSEKVARNPNNANILKGGQVDPRSQLYQRSIAGREQLKDYLSRLSNSGADEADVFMAGVKSLMNRGHGYVGAYLDSKNPGRRYEKNQAMAITDKVMTDEGIGEHPGARLTRPKVEDEEGNIDKEATKEARDKRKEANAGRGSGPQQAPGPSAKPVGQQRKEGKRESTGQPLEDSRRDTKVGKREPGPASEWQNTLESRMKGEASTQDVLSAFQKQYQSKIKTAPKGGGGKPAQPPSGGGGQPPTGGTPSGDNRSPSAQPSTAPDEQETDSEVDEEGRETATPKMYLDAFKDAMMGNIQNNVPVNSKKSQEGLIEEILDVLSDNYDVDENQARKQILRTYGRMGIGGYKLLIDPAKKEISPQDKPPGVPEPQEQAQTAPAPAPQEQSASPPQVKYKKPNIEREWNEAARYPEFETAGIEGWSDAVKNGKPTKFSQLGDVNNVDLNYDSLDEGKKNNFQQAFKDGVIETPIVGRFEDGSYELIAGNTRLSGLVKNGVDPTVMVVDFPSGEGEDLEGPPEEQTPNRATRRAQGQRGSGPRGKKTRGTERRGFGGETKPSPEQIKAIKEKVAKVPKEQLIKEMKLGNLFGQTAFETGSAATNPLEDSPPDQYERFRGDPAEKFKGAQEGGRETSSGSLFVSPQTAAKRGVKGTIDTESGPVKNPELYTSPRTGSGYGSAGQEQKGAIESKKSIQASAYEGMTPEQKNEEVAKLVKDGTSLSKARKQVGVKSRSAKKAPKPKKSFSGAEYQEFAQSIRSMMR
jgi:hypothetical protein